MEAILSQQRLAIPLGVCAIGIAVFWLANAPFGLLAPMAALFLFARGRAVLPLHAASVIGLTGSLFVAAFHAGAAHDLAVTWAAFFAVALCIGAIVATSAIALPGAVPMPVATSTAHSETPSYPVIGPSLEEKAAPRHSPHVSISAQDDKATTAQLVAVSFWGGVPLHLRYWRRQSDGRYQWVESRSEPLREPSGTRLWSSVTADIDDQRPAQAPPTKVASNPSTDDDAVRAAKIVENLLGNAWAFDPAGRPTYLTPLAQTFVAVTLKEFQAAVDEGHTFFKRTAHPDDYDRISTAWRHCLKTGDPFFLDRRIRRASGIHEWNRTGFVPTRDRQGRITGWYGATIDLDSHRIAQAELREREQELSQLVDMVPSHIWRLAPNGEPIFFNKRMVDFVGFDVPDTEKRGASRLEAVIATIHPDDAATFREAINRCLVTGESFAMRYRMRRADGVYRWMSSRAEPMRGQDGQIVQWYGLCHDIDDQVHAEEALRRSERQLQQMIDAVPAMMWSTSREGTPIYVNNRFTDVIGATLKDITAADGSPALGRIIHPDDLGETVARVTESFTTGVPYVMRYRQLRRDGSYRWTETRAEALRDESGEIIQWYGVSVDIDDLVKAQEGLRDRERELAQLVDMVPIHIRRLTPQGEPIFFNKRLLDFFGFEDVSELDKQGRSRLVTAMQTLVHPDDSARLLETVRSSFAAGEPFTRKYRMRRADGAYRWVDTRAEPLRNQSGAIVQWYVVSLDIDDEVRAQEALRDRERELAQLVDMIPVHIRRLTPEGEVIFLNKRAANFLGADLADLRKRDTTGLVRTVKTFVHQDDAASLQETVRRSLTTGEGYAIRYRARRADGVYRWLEGRVEPVRDENGRIAQWYGVSIDIDDEVRAQEALRDRERELSQLVDLVPAYIRRLTPEGEPVFFNKRLTDFIGVDLAAIGTPGVGRLAPAIEDFVHPDEAGKLLAAVRHAVATGEGYAMKYRLRRADGVYRWIETRAEPVRNQEGKIAQWYVVSIDVDDQMRAEAALRRSLQQLRQLIDAVPTQIWSLKPDGEPAYMNKTMLDYMGMKVEDYDRKKGLPNVLRTIHPEDQPSVLSGIRQSLSTGEPFELQWRNRRHDGAYRWTNGRATPLRDENGSIIHWYGVNVDIHDMVASQEALRLAQERLARASQAASLAELSASIAHEVNQPLAAIVANSHACQRWLSAEPTNVERAKITVERIIRDANAAADVVSRIRALFRQSLEPRDSTAISAVIAEARDLMTEEAGRRRVRMDVDVESNLPLIPIDRVQVQQVLINLIRNGMDAMDTTPGDRVLGMRVRRMGHLVQTEISDRGRGVEFPDKIFEPFFTTKENGMGMGLAICRSIIESHGGRLWAEKNEPHGARFIFTLPQEVKTAQR